MLLVYSKLDCYKTLSLDILVFSAVILFIHDQANNVTFQQDNARLHVMRVLCDYLTQQNIDVLRGQLVHSIFHPLSTSEMKWNSSYVICKISQ